MGTITTNYLDASAIVKLIVEEDGHKAVRDYFADRSVFLTTSLCFAEAIGVLGLKYKRGEIDEDQYLIACEELLTFLRDGSIEITDVDISKRETFDAVEKMMLSHNSASKKKRLDLSDAFQLVTLKKVLPGLARSSLLLVTADEYLSKIAKKEGFRAWYVMGERAPG